MKIGFIFTNYNNSQLTKQAIDSIKKTASDSIRIVVVDNCSDQQNLDILRVLEKEYGNLHVIFNKKNIGYFPGLNVGIKYFKAYLSEYNYLVVGNNDVIFSEDFISNMQKKMKLFSKYPVVSPNIITLDGCHQNPHVITKVSKFREFMYDLFFLNYWLGCYIVKLAYFTRFFTDRKDELQHEKAQEIYQGYGACYILGPLFLQNFNELLAPTFLTYEEFFLSKQLADRNLKIYYEPSIQLTHLLHASTNLLPKKQKWLFARDAHKEYRKYVKVFSSK